MNNEIVILQKNPISKNFNDHVKTFHSYSQKDKSDRTRRAYRFGWKRFINWIDEHGYQIKREIDHLAFLTGAFLSDMAKTEALKYSSLVSYHAAIKHHIKESMNIELEHEKITSAMRGIRKTHKQIPVKKEGVKAEHVSKMASNISNDSLIDIRDRALLLIGFSGAFRRSELVGIDFDHITRDPEGISIHIPFSKTDQEGKGDHVEIPRQQDITNCPIVALERWISALESRLIEDEIGGEELKKCRAIFRPITKHGKILHQRLSGKAIASIMKKRSIVAFENTSDVSGHSLRRGFVLTAVEANIDPLVIMMQTRHASVNTLKEYASAKKNYKTNALNSIRL